MRFGSMIAVLAIAAGSASPALAAAAMPRDFQGEWAVKVGDCENRGGENLAGFRIKDHEVARWEVLEDVRSVRILSPLAVSYQGEATDSAGSFPVYGTLRLSPDRKRLIAAGLANGMGRKAPDLVRCP